MMDSERGDLTGEAVDVETEIAARKSRRTAKENGSALGFVLVAVVGGLLCWGVFSVGAWVWNGISSFGRYYNSEVEAADRMIAANRARQAAYAAETKGDVSDAVVKAGAMSAIKERAVDPGSVRFRNVFVVRQASGTKAVCGEFNAKNRMGGYNGYERFISAGVGQYTYSEADVADFSTAWSTICQR